MSIPLKPSVFQRAQLQPRGLGEGMAHGGQEAVGRQTWEAEGKQGLKGAIVLEGQKLSVAGILPPPHPTPLHECACHLLRLQALSRQTPQRHLPHCPAPCAREPGREELGIRTPDPAPQVPCYQLCDLRQSVSLFCASVVPSLKWGGVLLLPHRWVGLL